MKKIVGILLLFLLLWQIVGFVGYFEHSYYLVKKQIKKQLEETVLSDNVLELTLTDSEFAKLKWIKNDEFEWHGNLFDVIRKKHSNNTYRLYCISDKEETTLFAGVGKKVAGDLSDKNKSPGISIWFKFLQNPSIPFYIPEIVLNDVDLGAERHSFHYEFSVITCFVNTPSQPPCA